MIFIQRAVCFLSTGLGKGIENTQLAGCNHITKHGRSFKSYIYHPYLLLLTSFFGGRGNTQCDIKKLSHEWYHIDIKDWLIIYCFTSAQEYFTCMETSPFRWRGPANLGLCSALRAFEQGEIIIVSHLLWHGTSVFPVSSKRHPMQLLLTTHKGKWKFYSNLDRCQGKYVINRGSWTSAYGIWNLWNELPDLIFPEPWLLHLFSLHKRHKILLNQPLRQNNVFYCHC
jgi:hypothetical protein